MCVLYEDGIITLADISTKKEKNSSLTLADIRN